VRLSSELREIRPYLGVDRVQRVLEDIRLRVGDRLLEPGGRASLSTRSFLRDRVAIVLGDDESEVEHLARELQGAVFDANLPLEKVSLILLMSSSRLKISDVVWSVSIADLQDLSDAEVSLTEAVRPRALRTPFGGCSVRMLVALTSDLDPAPLRPWRLGTWMAKTDFVISTDLGEIGFTPLPLDDAERQRQGLPEGVIRYAVVEDPFIQSPGPDAVLLYIDEDILAQMADAAYTPGSKTFQRQLFVDAMAAVVSESTRRLAENPSLQLDEIEGSIAWKLLCLVGRVDSSQAKTQGGWAALRRLYGLLGEAPEKFMAELEAAVPDLKKSITDSIQEGRK